MDFDAKQGKLSVTVERCTADDVERLRDTLDALGPFSDVRVDFIKRAECEPATLLQLSQTLSTLPNCRITLRGLTAHQARVLAYCGYGDDLPS